MAFGRRQQAQQNGTNGSPPVANSPRPDDVNRSLGALKNMVQMLMRAYDDGGYVHAETIIGAAAALTGEFALRATGLPLPEKGYVFGDQINAVLFEGDDEGRLTVWDFLSGAAESAGGSMQDVPEVEDIVARIAAAINGPAFPPLSVPAAHYPHEWSPNACPALRGKVFELARAHGLSPHETVFALAMATAKLVLMSKDDLDPAIAVTLAAEITFAVAKMAPLAHPITDELRS